MDTAQLCKLYSESTRFEIQVTEGNTGVASSFRPLYKRIMRQYVWKLPPRTCPGCSVPEPYRSYDWALGPAGPASKAEY